ncbi:hypothetical protein ACFIJ5_18685 (plasmid) [Haloimpatiens sp. FM7330]|uniref:hypothetical protein n=1 Tax=Haloimpatiens sp. FM7330 TaxID=3298610 RepID=UPI00362F9A4B
MNNIYFMIVISIILFLINLLYISSEEKIKKRTLKIAALGITIFFIALCVNKYINYNKSILASKILNSNKETVYIIDKGNQDLSSYCKSKNINFLEQNSISLKKYKNKNIVVISKYGSKLTNNINNILKLNIELDERDLLIKNNGIYDVNSFRILVNNPLNKENKILVIQSRSINSKDLNTLLNEKHGDFAAVKNGSVVANAVYNPEDINANNCFEKINTLNNRGWLIKKINGAEMLYRNLEKKDVKHLFSLWGKIKNVIDKNITGTHSNKQFQVYFRNDDVNLEQNFIPLKIDLLIDLEKRREYKIRDAFCKKYLDTKGFKFISDERLKDGWEEFILQTKVLYDDSAYENEYIRGIKEKLKKENQFSKEYDYSYFAQKMLCLINNKDKRMNFINKIISNNSQISNSEIEKIYSKYVGSEEAKNAMKYFNKK